MPFNKAFLCKLIEEDKQCFEYERCITIKINSNTNCMLTDAKYDGEKITLHFFHREKGRSFEYETDVLIPASGYI